MYELTIPRYFLIDLYNMEYLLITETAWYSIKFYPWTDYVIMIYVMNKMIRLLNHGSIQLLAILDSVVPCNDVKIMRIDGDPVVLYQPL